MATTNPVYNVLAASGNQAILAAGNRVTALANGQLGFFNYHTGLSVDGSVPATAKDIFIAVGINRTTGGTDAAEDIKKSAGQMIQVRNAKALTVKGYVAQVEKVQVITGFTAKCDTDYAVKLDVTSPLMYNLNGYNQNAKTYNYKTGCCVDTTCATCGDSVELALGLVNNINADVEAVFTASLFGNRILGTFGAPTSDATATVVIGGYSYSVPVLDLDTATIVATKVAAAINADTDSPYLATSAVDVVTAYPKSPVAAPTAAFSVTGAGVTVGTLSNVNTTIPIADVPAFKLAYPGASLGISITTNVQARPAFGDINVKYYRSGVDFNTYLVEGFTCNGTVTTTVAFQAKEGSGYDIKQLEYVAEGWGKGGPYRTNSITGLAKPFESFLTTSANYTVISLAYDQESVGGWLEYKNNLETIIAIPCADTVTLLAFFVISDLIFTQFGAMTNDVTGMDCTNTNITTINDTTADGIESLG